MSYGVEPDEQALVDAARDYARSALLPLDRQCDPTETPITSALPELADMGFLSICLAQDDGGLGCSYRAYAAILHELSYASPSACVTVAVHNMVGAILDKVVTPEQRKAWLHKFGRAESFAAFALSEAGAGSDAGATRCQGDRVGDQYILNGEKMWITNGLSARWFLTIVRDTSVTNKTRPLTALLVDGRLPGIRRDKIRGKMGIRASETAVLHFENTAVPVGAMLGQPGEGLRIALAALDRGRVGIAAQALGIAEACLDEMVSYARTRTQFDRPIGEFQAIQNMVADSAVELAAARALTTRAAATIDAGTIEPADSAKAKLYATEAANRIAYRAVQLHGGAGFVHESRVEQLFRDARVTTIYEGSSEIQRKVIARECFNPASLGAS